MSTVSAKEAFNTLKTKFNLQELKTLAFSVGIPYEDLEGSGRSGKALAMVQYSQRHGKFDQLVEEMNAPRDEDVTQSPSEDTSAGNVTYIVQGDMVQGDKVGQDKVAGDKTAVDTIQNSSGVSVGSNSSAQVTNKPVASTQPITETKGHGEAGSAKIYGQGNRWAVLVGVNKYDDYKNYGKLHVCVKDVEATQGALIAGGYDPERIRLITDDSMEEPSRANILTALKSVANATEPDDSLLFYYSGHGAKFENESYLVGKEGRRLILNDTAISVSRVKEILAEAPARAKMIILDACHSGADIGKGGEPMSAEFIRRVFAEAEGMMILSSCKQEQLSYEWHKQERSVFTHYLMEAISGKADKDGKGFVTMQDASRHVVDGVKLWAAQNNTSQSPTLQSQVAGDIILAKY